MVDVWYTAGTPVSLQPKKEYHYQFKIVVVGDTSVGKSSFLRRYMYGDRRRNTLSKIDEEDNLDDSAKSRFHLDETQKTIVRSDKVVKLTIWDTAGEQNVLLLFVFLSDFLWVPKKFMFCGQSSRVSVGEGRERLCKEAVHIDLIGSTQEHYWTVLQNLVSQRFVTNSQSGIHTI